jgi:hypothetical protein
MTATAHQSAASLQQLAPNVTAKVRAGDLVAAQFGLLAIGVVLTALAWATGKHFLHSYLVGYMGVLGVCLGGLVFVLIQHITRAGWSVVVRRVAENLAAALPVMALLFVPILLGMDTLYGHWTNADPADGVLAGKSSWLNPGFFYGRAAAYFAIWIAMALYFRAKSIEQDETGDPAISLRLSRLAAPGLLVFALTITFAAFDWVMALDPHWFSTIFGVAFFAGAYMAFYAWMVVFLRWLGSQGYLSDAVSTEHYHDLGKLLFTFMIFWTYTNFSQYMLIWYANLPEETHWFLVRANNGWATIGRALILGHFFFPFAFLMSRHVKRNKWALVFGSACMLVIHCIDMQFLILPGSEHHGAAHGGEAVRETTHEAAVATSDVAMYLHQIDWADFGCFLGLLAIVTGVVIFNIRRTTLLPQRDPRLAESLHFLNH